MSLAMHVLDSLLEGCQVVGFDGTYLYLNDAAVAQSKRSRDELIGRTMVECYPGIEHTAMYSMLQRCARDRVHYRMDNEFEFPDGSTGWFELRFVPVPEGTCILSLDVTEQRRAVAAELRANETLRALFDGVRDYAIYGLDPSGHVLTWNSGAERMKGYTAEEIIGADYRRFFPPEDLASGKPDALLAEARAVGRAHHEGWRVRKDGTRFWADVTITALTDTAGTHVGFAKVSRDMTQYRKLEEQFRQAQKMEAVGRLAGGVAHDFNNLLSVVLSYSALLIADLRPEDPMRADLEEIEKAGVRATSLTRQLLAFSRQQVIQPKVVDLRAQLNDMARMLGRLSGEDIELNLHTVPDLGRVLADPGYLEQVVMNLVVNARDAMPRGGRLTIEAENVELDAAFAREHLGVTPGSYVLIAVSDTGIGMDRETLEHIFEPFFTTKPTGQGTGLGLSTVFGIVRQLGGRIWVYSELGQGTTFKIFLPRSDAAPTAAACSSAVIRMNGAETILLVEDEDPLRVVVRGILAKNGYRVLEARNAGEAILLCETHEGPIGLLLTDVIMPHMSGPVLADRLAQIRPEMPVLYMSGYTDQAMVHHGMLDAAIELLQKPITPDSLLRRVRQVLDDAAND